MPEKAPSASVRPAALGRPRIPPRSSARTAPSPLFWLNLLARSCCAKIAGCWLVLKRTCCVEVAGCWLVLKRTYCVKVAGCWLVPKRTCCIKVAGCWLVLKRTCCVKVAGCWLILVHLLRKTGLLPSDSSVAPPGSRARKSHWNSAALVQFHTRGCKQF